jgi:hypothetical protein
MRRKLLMGLLGLGALAGFAHGFAHLRHHKNGCGASCHEERDRRGPGCREWRDEAAPEGREHSQAQPAATTLSQN